MKEGPEAEKFAKQLAEQEKRRKDAKASSKRGGAADGASESMRSKKPRVDLGRCLETYDPSVPQLKIPLPFTLKKQLVEDWERSSQMDPMMLVPLPRVPCVAEVVAQYLEAKAKRTNQSAGKALGAVRGSRDLL